jgi:glycosyltransferase involved in cell wall biosynthesis
MRPDAPVMVDARMLRSSGIGRCLREILRGLLSDGRFPRFTLLGSPSEIRGFLEEVAAPRGDVDVVEAPTRPYSPAFQLHWAMRLRRIPSSAALFPHFDAPMLAMPRRSVVMIHDLSHFLHPELFAGWRRSAGSLLLRRSVEQATVVAVGNEVVARDVSARFPRLGERMRIVPFYGVDEAFSGNDSEQAGARLPEAPFILFVGNGKPSKNVRGALRVVEMLREEHPGVRLVVVGRDFGEHEQVRQEGAEGGDGGWVDYLGEVDDQRLARLYRGAAAFLFPSLAEGFGIPVIEAMAAGTPVVASNRGGLPVAAGEAGWLFEPEDHAGMAGALRRLLTDPVERRRRVAAGREQAARFSWAEVGRRYADLLDEVAGGGAPEGAPGAIPAHARPSRHGEQPSMRS